MAPNDLFEPFYNSLKIATTIGINQRNLDAEKAKSDQAFQMGYEKLMQEAKQQQDKIATEVASKSFEESMKQVDPNNPETVRRAMLSGANLEQLVGRPILPRDASGAITLPGLTWRTPDKAQVDNKLYPTEHGYQTHEQAIGLKQPVPPAVIYKNENPSGPAMMTDYQREQVRLKEESQQNKLNTPEKPMTEYQSEQLKLKQQDMQNKKVLLDAKTQQKLESDGTTLEDLSADLDSMSTAAKALATNKGIDGITGVQSRVPSFPGSAASEAEADLESLKSKIAVNVMMKMKNASKTGATGFGQLSEKELTVTQTMLASLDNKKLSAEGLRKRLLEVAKYAEDVKARFQKAYDTKLKEIPGNLTSEDHNQSADDFLKSKMGGK